MKHCSWLLFLVACSYNPPTSPGGDDDGEPPGVDAGIAPTERTCLAHPNSTLCLEFEEPGTDTAFDGSLNRYDADADDVIEMSRAMSPAVADHRALGFGITSKLDVTQDLELDGDVTVEMWVQILPGVSRNWLFDSNRRFFMSYGSDQQIRCGINYTGFDVSQLRVDSEITIADSAWHHVACTFERATTQMKVYIDGSTVGCKQFGVGITARPGGTTIGAPHDSAIEHLVGGLDSVHVYKEVLAAAAICTSANGSVCKTACPGPDSEGPPNQGPGGFGGGN